MSEDIAISVLLPVHGGVRPNHLRACLDSVYGQTYAAQEVIVVEDGPLDDAHHEVLESFAEAVPVMYRVSLEHNRGAGIANQTGLLAANCEWIAKMDADDVCLPERLETQVHFVLRTGVDICGSAMLEFEDDLERVTGVRGARLLHDEIAVWMRTNNPMNHSTTMFRRQLAVEAGGYSDMRFMQDYDLFARMLAHGARFGNIARPLVAFRADASMYSRRKARAMDLCEWRLQRSLRAYGVISTPRMWWNLALRSTFRRLPRPVLKLAYGVLFRQRKWVLTE